MSQQIEHRSTSPFPADEVFAAMVDRAYLDARLAEIGGPGAGVIEYEMGADGGHYRLRHGLDPKDLPSIVRNVLPGSIAIERTERWTRRAEGGYDGTSTVDVAGTPASAVGGMRLRDAAGGSELVVRTDVTVALPLIGGRIESVMAEQVKGLLAGEAAFTARWLDSKRS